MSSESIDYSLKGVVPVGALSKFIVDADPADGFSSRIPPYSGFNFLLRGKERDPVGRSIVVEYLVARYWLESGIVSIAGLGKLLEAFGEILGFFFPHPFQSSFGALQGCGSVIRELWVAFGEW